MCEPLSFCQDEDGDIYHLFPMLWPSREYDVVKVYNKEYAYYNNSTKVAIDTAYARFGLPRTPYDINHNSHTIICDAFGLSEERDGVAKYEMWLTDQGWRIGPPFGSPMPQFHTDYAPPWLTSWHKHTAINWAESLSLSDLSVLAMIITVMNRSQYDIGMLKAAFDEQDRRTMSVARRMAIEGMK